MANEANVESKELIRSASRSAWLDNSWCVLCPLLAEKAV